MVYISTSGSGTASGVAGLNNWSINRATDKIEVTAFADANKTYVIGLPDLSGSFTGFWDDTETKIFAAAASSDGAKIYLYPSSDAASVYHYGPAWIDASMETPVGGAVGISVNFVANGSWGSKGLGIA